MKQAVLIGTVVASLVAGCQQAAPPDTSGQATPAAQTGSGQPVFANQLGGNQAPARLRVVQLDVYQLTLPLGAVSRSDEFWKHVDEQQVDVGTYDLLRRNGWRVGVAPAAEWGYFKDIVDAYPATSKPSSLSTGTTGGTGAMEVPMRRQIPYQIIFYTTGDAAGFRGQAFERCDNLLGITLQQVPRKPGEARVTVCPVVRSIRGRYKVSKNFEEREIRYVHPERLYDLNLQVDIPMNHFLVIAPSPEVKWTSSLGATFLVEDGVAERVEHVLLMVPRAAELEERVSPGTAAAPAR